MSLRNLLSVLILSLPGLPATAADMGELPNTNIATNNLTSNESLVQIAILLDTSGSMEGLVDQARCQLWNVVTELSKASRGDEASKLEIAVYQYGTESISKNKGCLRQVIGFTEDLDDVSQALFSLKIGGGDEFCGEVIDKALTDLEWNPASDVYKSIFIVGNEPFDQGTVTFGQALPKALSGSIVLNSIYCYDPKVKVAVKGMDQWEAAAKLTEGMYFRIDHNHHLPRMKTPFDSKMRELNRKMNETFIWYGNNSDKAANNQQAQDRNAAKMSDHAFAARMSAKIGHLYHHVHDDLIDAISHGVVKLDNMPVDKMPEALKKMTPEMREEFINTKIADRNRVRRLMAEVISQRHSFLQQKMSEQIGKEGKSPQVLGDALAKAVRSQTTQRGFKFSEGRTEVASGTP